MELDVPTESSNRACPELGGRAKTEFMNYLEVVDIKDLFKTRVKGKFFLIKYKYDSSREADFLEYLLDVIPVYALTKKERDSLSKNDSDKIRKLWKIAVDRFVKSSKTGEIGELILFHLLEIHEDAVQIVNKMQLKTSGEMHYHGADAVHFGFDNDLNVLYLGESKTGEKFSQILEDALSSTENYDKKKYDFEISLASGNLSEDLSEDMKKTIKDYLNPARPDLSKFKEVHAIFLGYQYDLIKSCEASACGEERYTKIIEGYKKEISNYLNKIEAGFEKHPKLQNTHFLFFIIPFRDLNGFKEGFKQGIIGV